MAPPHQPRSLATHDKAQHSSAKTRRRPFRTPLRQQKQHDSETHQGPELKYLVEAHILPDETVFSTREGASGIRGLPSALDRVREGPYAASGWDA